MSARTCAIGKQYYNHNLSKSIIYHFDHLSYILYNLHLHLNLNLNPDLAFTVAAVCYLKAENCYFWWRYYDVPWNSQYSHHHFSRSPDLKCRTEITKFQCSKKADGSAYWNGLYYGWLLSYMLWLVTTLFSCQRSTKKRFRRHFWNIVILLFHCLVHCRNFQKSAGEHVGSVRMTFNDVINKCHLPNLRNLGQNWNNVWYSSEFHENLCS